MKDGTLLSIGDICSETGLTVDVIRAWERRYGFPVPLRLPSGHRRYTEADLARLRLMAQAVSNGHRANRVAKAEDVGLRHMILPASNPDVEALFTHVLAMDGEAVGACLREHLLVAEWDEVLRDLVAPLLDRFSVAWADGLVDPHHEHLLSEVLEDFLRNLRREYHPLPGRGKVLLCTLPGERHRLGLLLATMAYAANGARTNVLGLDLPLASIAHAAKALGVDRVAVYMSVQSSGETVRRMLDDLRARLPEDCRLLLGGKGAARTRKVKGAERVDDLNVA